MNSIDECVYVQDDNLKNMELRGVPVLKLGPRGLGLGDLDLSKATVVFETPVPVLEDTQDGEVIGAAHLYRQGDQILADVFIAYSSPMRLTIEAGQRVTPMASGVVEKISGGQVLELRLESLVLSTETQNDLEFDLSKYVSN